MFQAHFAVWAQYGGLKIDGQDFDFRDYRYMIDIYRCTSEVMAFMKPAQVGATVYEMTVALHSARYSQCKVGFYFPGDDELNDLVQDRFDPLLKSNAALADAVRVPSAKDKTGLKRLANVHGGISSIYFRNIRGESATESVPMNKVILDEVRKMDERRIGLVEKRLLASKEKWIRYCSTAGAPGMNIDRRFLGGSQYVWLCRCRCQDGGVDLADVYPNCLAVRGNEVYLRCPRCKTRIVDPQNGQYVPRRQTWDYPSYNMSAMLSRMVSPAWILNEFNTTLDMEEHYNSIIGRPWVDVQNRPITEAVLARATRPELRWAYEPAAPAALRRHTYMGVDQHGLNCYVVILRRDRDGRLRVVHLEMVDMRNPLYRQSGQALETPFNRCGQLMEDFGVDVCVVDSMPNYNDARIFAQAFPGRAFLATYTGQEIVRWLDRDPDEQLALAAQDLWQVHMNRYRAIDFVLKRVVDGGIIWPHPDRLLQYLKDDETGLFAPAAVARVLFQHLRNMVRKKKIVNPETGEYKMTWSILGEDHFTHSLLYATVAAERTRGETDFFFI